MSHFALSDVSYHFLDSMSASANEDILSACAELYSDNLVKEAYSRMVLDNTKQKWMAHEKAEIDYLKRRINFSDINFAYDLGCGVGRHSILLAQDNIEVVGIDYISGNINEANRRKKEFKLSNLTFLNADIRHYRNHRKASLILCLYDVVGTFATKAENLEIIRTAYDLLSSDVVHYGKIW